MEIVDPRVKLEQGHPFLVVTIDGQRASIFWEQKALNDGFLYLGPEWEDRVKPVYLPADPEQGRPEPEPLHGFTDNAELLALYHEVMKRDQNGTLTEGPIGLE